MKPPRKIRAVVEFECDLSGMILEEESLRRRVILCHGLVIVDLFCILNHPAVIVHCVS